MRKPTEAERLALINNREKNLKHLDAIWEVRQLLEDLITSKSEPFLAKGISWFCSGWMTSGEHETVHLEVMIQSGHPDRKYVMRTLRNVFGSLFDKVEISFYNRPNDRAGLMHVQVNFYKESSVALAEHLKSKLKN